MTWKTDTFDYDLPTDLIAQTPLAQRDASRLLVLDRHTGSIAHRRFVDLTDYLRRGDLLVANDSRVLPARLHGHKSSGGKVELLLLERLGEARWRALVGGRRVGQGVVIELLDAHGGVTTLTASVTDVLEGSQRIITFDRPVSALLDDLGHMPLPPYIHSELGDPERYQTIFARPPGSAAAPTAGLHFTPELLFALREKGVGFETITLHVGLDTFKPVDVDEVADHAIHSEWIRLTPQAAKRINEAKLAGGRIVAVGTTSVRVLETAAWRSAGVTGSLREASQQPAPGFCPWKPVSATEGRTDLYIYPGYHYRVVDAMITNFHLPRSSLMMLVAAFAGLENMRSAYAAAIAEKYRFLSFGDAMLIDGRQR
jgi:S-adenosylmethionine:tRNA ribosyltransferase-isomerase